MNGMAKLYILLNVYAALFYLYQLNVPKFYFFKIKLFQSNVSGLINHLEKVKFYRFDEKKFIREQVFISLAYVS